MDGWNQYEGRVEVCDDGEWKTVCDRGWKVKEAIVVCRQLNYSDPSRKKLCPFIYILYHGITLTMPRCNLRAKRLCGSWI